MEMAKKIVLMKWSEVKMYYQCVSFPNLYEKQKQHNNHPVIPSKFTQPHTSQLQYCYGDQVGLINMEWHDYTPQSVPRARAKKTISQLIKWWQHAQDAIVMDPVKAAYSRPDLISTAACLSKALLVPINHNHITAWCKHMGNAIFKYYKPYANKGYIG